MKISTLFVCLLSLSLSSAHAADRSIADLSIVDLGKDFQFNPTRTRPGLYHHLETSEVTGGNTSLRNESAETLAWKGQPDSNGFGYFQRNRDLGQVFNVPAGDDVRLDAIVLRTSRGNNAVMAGTPGAAMYVQLYRVVSDDGEIRIDENGTTVGQRATHGFDHQFNRCDDFVAGDAYEPIGRFTGGLFPDVPPTTQYTYQKDRGTPFGEQPGHLRFFRIDIADGVEPILKAGQRYAFLVGFESPGTDRGLALAISSSVHEKKPAEFVRDENDGIRWGIRREGDGGLIPTMVASADPPADQELRSKLIGESMFPANHFDTIGPSTDGYPDVATYQTLQFYVEVK